MRRIDEFGERYLEDDGDGYYCGPISREEDMSDEEKQARFNHAYDPIEKKVTRACLSAGHKKVYVQYSAFDDDDSGYPLDNLDEVAFDGNDEEPLGDNLIIYLPKSYFFGGVKSLTYKSPILNSPTWLEIAVIANKAIKVTRDKHHVYLEGLKRVYPRRARIGIKYYKLIMGS